MDQYLERFSGPAPTDSIVVYHLPSENKFICKDFVNLNHALVESLIKSKVNHSFSVNLNKLLYHSLIFNINVHHVEGDTTDILMRYFDQIFLNVLEQYLGLSTFTVLLAIRRDRSGGLHVHVPGFAIAHDDYVHMCHLIDNDCRLLKNREVICEMICPVFMPLIASGKPKGFKDTVYVPLRLVSVESKEAWLDGIWKPRTIKSVYLKYEDTQTESPFASIINATYRKAVYMMTPVPEETWSVLYYPTRIVHDQIYAHFTCVWNNQKYRIQKDTELENGGAQSGGSYYYKFVKRYSDSIKSLALPFRQNLIQTYDKNDFFESINKTLVSHCIHLRGEPNPLQTILMNADNVVPVFFALCHVMRQIKPQEIANALVQLHKPVEDILKNASAITRYPTLPFSLTFQTILYCAFNTVPTKMKTGGFEENIGMGWDWIFETITTVGEMKEHLTLVQKTHFPIVQDEKNLYAWNYVSGKWEIITENDLPFKMEKIFDNMTFLEGFSKIPTTVQKRMNYEKSWLYEIAYDLLPMHTIKGNTPPTTFDEMFKLYGRNVPEYLFFEFDVAICSDENL